jgi:hypothetical protein
MQCCNREMSNFSHYPGHTILENKVSHFYCSVCDSHFYKDKHYTKEEWFFYINGETYAEYRKREDL